MTNSPAEFDIAIIGSGFAGSLTAMICRKIGFRVLMLEKSSHPRFAIGESSTPLANLLLESLSRRYSLDEIAAFAKWGSWQEKHPSVGCGLKRGFSFFHHRAGQGFQPESDSGNELLVAASPRDAIADTHWFREDLDGCWVDAAQRHGVEYLDRTEIVRTQIRSRTVRLEAIRKNQPINFQSRFLIDASGPNGFLRRHMQMKESLPSGMPATQSVFSHFRNVRRWEEVVSLNGNLPYPPDDAALHHVFEGGWIWALRFNNGITSAGAVLTAQTASAIGGEGRELWDRLLARYPTIQLQFGGAKPVRPFIHLHKTGFHRRPAAGERWALLPSSYGFIDPLLSTGFPLTLLGIQTLVRLFEGTLEGPELNAGLQEYERETASNFEAAKTLIGALYGNFDRFNIFRALSKLYFAAASFSETCIRLGKPEQAPGFLLCGNPHFWARARRCCEEARRPLTKEQAANLIEEIEAAAAPFDVAGLTRKDRIGRFPVEAVDLMEANDKLGVSKAELETMLRSAKFFSDRSDSSETEDA